MSNQGKIEEVLLKILQQESLSRNEICCKLRELNDNLIGGTGIPPTIISGINKLTDTASFTTATPLSGGTTYRSVSMTVISLTTGTVTVTDPSGATVVSYPGYSTSWAIDKDTDAGLGTGLTIATTGDAIVIVSYTIE